MKTLVLSLALLLAGCSNTAWRVSAGESNPGAPLQVHAHGSSGLATLFGLGIIAGSVYEAATNGFDAWNVDTRRPPEMAPNRKVSEQDCTKPIDWSAGNLRCK